MYYQYSENQTLLVRDGCCGRHCGNGLLRDALSRVSWLEWVSLWTGGVHRGIGRNRLRGVCLEWVAGRKAGLTGEKNLGGKKSHRRKKRKKKCSGRPKGERAVLGKFLRNGNGSGPEMCGWDGTVRSLGKFPSAVAMETEMTSREVGLQVIIPQGKMWMLCKRELILEGVFQNLR